jgi:hypothetical protein
MMAMLVLEELHVTEEVRSCVLPSVYIPVAVNCKVPPTKVPGRLGDTAKDFSTAVCTVRLTEPLTAPTVA